MHDAIKCMNTNIEYESINIFHVHIYGGTLFVPDYFITFAHYRESYKMYSACNNKTNHTKLFILYSQSVQNINVITKHKSTSNVRKSQLLSTYTHT